MDSVKEDLENDLDDDQLDVALEDPVSYARKRQSVFSITSSGGFLGSSQNDAPSVTLCFRNINVTVKQAPREIELPSFQPSPVPAPSCILQNVTGVAKAGQLLAIMGSSGSGKSTLMNALIGKHSNNLKVDGVITANGRRLGHRLSRITAYLHQDNLFFPVLTVKEHLTFHAALRLGDIVDKEERKQRVHEVISAMGLLESSDVQLKGYGSGKGLSGGELRRLAFATELLMRPSIFICDEPTTGLDSFMAEQLVMILRQLASNGMTIISVIHQPSSSVFALFDRVIFLAHGKIAYQGPVSQSTGYFRDLGFPCPETYNPADYIIGILSLNESNQQEKEKSIDQMRSICSSYEKSTLAQDVEKDMVPERHRKTRAYEEPDQNLDKIRGYKTNVFVEAGWLLWRSLLLNFRDPNVLRTRVIQKLILGVIYGLIFHGTIELTQEGIQNANGAMLCLVIESSFRIVLNVVQMFVYYLPLFKRENGSYLYRASSYYIANALSWVPVFLVDTTLFTLICYFLMGLSLDAYKFFMTLLMSLLIAHVSCAVGSFLAYVSPSMPVAVNFAQQTQYLVMLFSGALYINLNTYPKYLSWIQYFSWMRYGFEGMSIIHWSGIQNISCSNNYTSQCLTTGIEVLKASSYDPDNLAFDFGLSLALFAGFHLAAFACLVLRIKFARN